MGLFHVKAGVDPHTIFPDNLGVTPCGHFNCLGYECAFDGPTCAKDHIPRWKKYPDQDKILAHFDKTGKAWLDSDIVSIQRINIPDKFKHLVGDASGPKRA